VSLKQQAVSGFKWSISAQLGQQVMHFVTLAVLTRLLSPSDYGLVGMATVIINFTLLFKDLGTAAAIVQRKDLPETLLSSIFWVNLLFGGVVMLALFLVAPAVGNAYQQPALPPIFQALSFSFIIASLGITQNALLQRSLAFRAMALTQIGAYAAGAVAGITAALLGAGAWSIVAQNLTTAAVTSVLLWLASPWRPRFLLDWRAVLSVSDYSLNLTAFYAISYFTWNADYLLIGLFLGSEPLGYYTLAYRLMLYPMQHVSNVLVRVAFPLYAQMQDDNERLGSAYLKSISAIGLVTFPMVMGLAAIAEPLILTVSGEKWRAVVAVLVILSPVGLIQTILTTVEPIYQAKSRTDLLLRWGIVRTIVSVIAFLIGLPWGINGVAIAYMIATLLLFYPAFALPLRLINLKMTAFLGTLSLPLLGSLLMLAVLVGLRATLLAEAAYPLMLAVMIPVGALVYAIVSWSINRSRTREILAAFRVKI
jgi:PST family polysaccharide transporter